PSAKLETIFDQFFRLDASRSTNSGGAGLGLAIAKKIVTAHGGNITATSNEERTVFTVTLPNQDGTVG
ncbi:MAG TPA: ATP-binding protein, partial [Bacillota bacterium]|nr:ATP-binding protein [Bacillota bacterium]